MSRYKKAPKIVLWGQLIGFGDPYKSSDVTDISNKIIERCLKYVDRQEQAGTPVPEGKKSKS